MIYYIVFDIWAVIGIFSIVIPISKLKLQILENR